MSRRCVFRVTCCRSPRHNCWICRKPYNSSLDLSDHVIKAHIIYQCCCCSYNTDQYLSLMQHSRDKHNKSDLFHCPRCHFLSYNSNDLLSHYQESHDSTGYAYYCTLCGYSTVDLATIEKHLKVKHNTIVSYCDGATISPCPGEKPYHLYKYNCSFCPYKSNEKSSLLQHFYDKHWLGDGCFYSGSSYYYDSCTICDETLDFSEYNNNMNKYDMYDHLLEEHNTSVECCFCKQIF